MGQDLVGVLHFLHSPLQVVELVLERLREQDLVLQLLPADGQLLLQQLVLVGERGQLDAELFGACEHVQGVCGLWRLQLGVDFDLLLQL